MPEKKLLLLTLDIQHSTPNTLFHLLSDPWTDGSILDRIEQLHNANQKLMEMLVLHPKVMPITLVHLFKIGPVELKRRILELKGSGPAASSSTDLVPASGVPAAGSFQQEESKDEGEIEAKSLFQRVQRMTVSEKIQFALRAGKDARSLLLKDPNRQVYLAVLSGPKITEDEILTIAQSRNVSDEILRAIGKNKEWIKNYSILLALVSNPKTPVGISMTFLPAVRHKDLALLAKNRNLPEAVRSGANRLVIAKQKQR